MPYGQAARLFNICGLLLALCVGVAAADERPLRLVAFGDSLTAGYRLKVTAAFPAQLEHAVRPVKGERLVLLAWVTSSLSDPTHRETVYRLTRAMELLPSNIEKNEDYDEIVSAVAFARENLLRAWSS